MENSLDACESVSTLPDIDISLQELGPEELNAHLGVRTHERLDQTLFERGGGKKKGAAAAPQPDTADADENGGGAADAAKSGRQKSGDAMYYRVTVRDNGCGMKHEQIPDFLGRVLSGSKYGVRQTRGKFGLGAKMALIWSKQSTGSPVDVRSSQAAGKQVSVCRLDIDIQKNEPRVKLHEQVPNEEGWRGTEISLLVGGNWSTYRSYIVRYLRQMAVITPYARFRLNFATRSERGTLALEYARRSEEMPRPPQAIKHHPASVHVELLSTLLRESKEKMLVKFLARDFSCVSPQLAAKLLKEMRLPPEAEVSKLEHKQTVALSHLMRDVKFDAPPGDCLSPVGEYNLRLGIMKELRPDLVATFQDAVCTHEGHPLIVEAGVCLGGRDAKPGLTVYRFANRIPLLFEGGADVATQVSRRRINWASYKIRQNVDKVGIFVSLVSTKVPFKGTGKEYIGDDIPEVQAAVKRAIERCCLQARAQPFAEPLARARTHAYACSAPGWVALAARRAARGPTLTATPAPAPLQLKAKLAKQRALADERERRKNLTKYIPDVSRALFSVLSLMASDADAAAAAGGEASSRKRLTSEHEDLLEQVRQKKLKEETLAENVRARQRAHLAASRHTAASHCASRPPAHLRPRHPRRAEPRPLNDSVCASTQLRTHVEQCDSTAALEQVTATGVLKPRQEIFLSPFNEKAPQLPEMFHQHFVLKLQRAALDTS